MKNLFMLFVLLASSAGLFAQECDNQRYFDEVFNHNVTSNVKFGEAPQPTLLNPNNIQDLFMDIYQPAGDTLSARPLIIWAFGGAFVFGTKLSPDIVNLSTAFAKRGYVNAAIDYRLSTDLLLNSSLPNTYEAVLKATHDMAASIRYFYKDAATNNEYRIDTNRIYIGGVSAGAITALQIAHLDEANEVPTEIDSLFQATGGFVGNSGNAGYSQNIAGVINLCGAVLDTSWINPAKDLPIVSLHGTDDSVVPYGSGTITILNIDLDVDGSATIHQKLDQEGVFNDFYTWPGAQHTPFVADQAYMDTTIWVVRDFLYDLVCQSVTGAEELTDNELPSFTVFPNPNNGSFSLQLEGREKLSIQVVDQLGRIVYSATDMQPGVNKLELDLPRGLYTLQARSHRSNQTSSQKLVVQ